MGKGNEKEEYADWSEEERTVHRLRDGLREVVAEGSFGAEKGRVGYHGVVSVIEL
mgnify:CR=1 FL=1